MVARRKPTHAEIIDSAEHFYHLRVTKDRQFILERSSSCRRDHEPEPYGLPDFTTHVWCPFAHIDRRAGSLFFCDCPCHKLEMEKKLTEDLRVILNETVDGGKWRVTVTDDVDGSDGYSGTLRVFEVTNEAETLVHSENVGVSYAARFGPDVADVAAWQQRALDVIDHPENRRTT